MATGPSQASYNSLLYKKIQGVPYTNTDTQPSLEQIGSSSVNVQLSQVWNQTIPTTAPGSLSGPIDISAGNPGLGKKYTNTTGGYSYLVQYTVQLTTINSGIAFYYAGTSTANVLGTNLLIGGIPFNQATAPGYAQTLAYGPTYNSASNVTVNYTTNPYYYDVNSGYLTFFYNPGSSFYNGSPNY